MATLIITAITVNASKNADKKAAEKQKSNETIVFERTLVTILVNKNNNKLFIKYIPATMNTSNNMTSIPLKKRFHDALSIVENNI